MRHIKVLAARNDVVVPDVVDAGIHAGWTAGPHVDVAVGAVVGPPGRVACGISAHQACHLAHLRHEWNLALGGARRLELLVHQRPEAAQVEPAELRGLPHGLEPVVAVVDRRGHRRRRIAPDAAAAVERVRLEPVVRREKAVSADAVVAVILAEAQVEVIAERHPRARTARALEHRGVVVVRADIRPHVVHLLCDACGGEVVEPRREVELLDDELRERGVVEPRGPSVRRAGHLLRSRYLGAQLVL